MDDWGLTEGDILLLFGAHKKTYDELFKNLERAVGRRADELKGRKFERFIINCARRLAEEELITLERRDGVGYYCLTELGLLVRKELLEDAFEYPLEPWDFLTPLHRATA